MKGTNGASSSGSRVPRQRKVRVDAYWGGDRRLIVIDVENVVGGPCNTAAKARWARRMLDDALGVRSDDQVVVATDACGVLSAGLVWPQARHLFGHGKDGADQQLLGVLEEDVVRRFRRVILVSGDGIFADTVAGLTTCGVEVTVVAHQAMLSRRLRRAATRTLHLLDARQSAS